MQRGQRLIFAEHSFEMVDSVALLRDSDMLSLYYLTLGMNSLVSIYEGTRSRRSPTSIDRASR
jgi:hypothetical protein